MVKTMREWPMLVMTEVVLPHRIIRLMEHRLQVQVSLRVEAQPMDPVLSQVHLDLLLQTTIVTAVQ